MRTIKVVVLGLGIIALAACTQTVEHEVLEPDATEIADDLDPQAKAPRTNGPAMACVQATGGCAPVGYRNVLCSLSGLKANTNVVVCVKGACPSVYGIANAQGETCYPEQKVALDGSARAFFPVRPDATYSFTTRSGAPKAGEPIASITATVSSSIGEDTQCGGEPVGCN